MPELIKNLLLGAGSILEISPRGIESMPKRLYVPPASDYEALRSDWQKVAGDLTRAFTQEVLEQEANPSK